MTYPKAIVISAALIAAALVWQGQAIGQSGGQANEAAREVKAVVSGELIWWLESSKEGPRVSVCAFDGRAIECDSKALDE